jgi:hypothetical protein
MSIKHEALPNLLNDSVRKAFRLFVKSLAIIGMVLVTACDGASEQGPWVLDCDGEVSESCAYVDANGKMMIDCNKYLLCFSETFDNYAIVLNQDKEMIAINKEEEVLYQVFVYDNGPDYPSDGYFRIIQDGKIGYADAQTGEIKIKPQYAAAKPFENQYAPVCPNCELVKEEDHSFWGNGKWGLIDKTGTLVVEPQYDDIVEISNNGEAVVVLAGEEQRIKIE